MENSGDTSLKTQALAFLKQGKAEESVKCLREFIKDNPNDDQAYSYLGAAHSARKEWDQAIQAFQQAVDLNPSRRAYYNLGLAMESAGRLDEASSRFANALADDFSYQPARDALDRVTLALSQQSAPVEAAIPTGATLLNPEPEEEDPNAVTVARMNASSSPVWADNENLDLSAVESRGGISPEEARQGPPSREQIEMEREAKILDTQKRMSRAGLIYGTGIGVVWYILFFFATQFFGINPLVAKFAEGWRFLLLLGLLGVVGAAIGAAVGYVVGRTGGGEGTGMRVGAIAGLVTEPIKAAIAGQTGLTELLIAATMGIFIGAFVGFIIGRLVEMSIGWD